MGILTTLAGAKYKIIAGVAVAAALAFAGGALYQIGLNKGKTESKIAILEYEKKSADLQKRLDEAAGKVTTKIVTEYVDRVVTRERIVYRNNDIIVEVVPETFNLTKGWIYAYNQTLLGKEIDPKIALNPEESKVTDRQGLTVIANNNAICVANADQLSALQAWIKGTEEARNETNANAN